MSEPGPSPTDRAVKRERVQAILTARGVDGLVLTSHGAIAWYLDGIRSHVGLAGDPVLAVLVANGVDTVVVYANERARLEVEELPSDVLVHAVAWHEPLSTAWATVPGLLREVDVAAELRAARASLLPAELARFRQLSADAACVLTDVLGAVAPQQSERAVLARVAGQLVERGIDPLVLLAAGRARRGYRHPLPTDAPLGNRAMVVVCGRRHGLITNVTRWVRFGAESHGEAGATAGILEVEARYFAATRPGALVSDALAAGSAAYATNGFDADEWRNHHQGGPAGYNGRDPRATLGLPDRVAAGGAFTWNPSALGAKVEDTVLVTDVGLEVLTVDPRWPTVRVHGRDRPAEMVL